MKLVKLEGNNVIYAVVVIFYNPDENAIDRISTYSDNFDDILIIDNSEIYSNKTVERLVQYNNCTYHKMNGNEGMAKALNYAFYRAIDKNFDFILSMDQDSIYSIENINNMKKYIEFNFDEAIGIFSPSYSKLYFDENSQEFIAAKSSIKRNEIKKVSFCMTSGSFVNVKALTKILPLEDYFISYVDNLLSTKLKENGYELIRVGTSYFSQQVGGIVKNTIFNRLFRIVHHDDIRYYYMVRNNLLLGERFKKFSIKRIKNRIGLFRILGNLLIGEKNKTKKLKACWKGYKDFKQKVMGKANCDFN